MWTTEMDRFAEVWSALRDGSASSMFDPTKLNTDVNRSIVTDCSVQIRAVFEQLSCPGNLPAVIHCTAGKDRTGFVVSLVLTILGVQYPDIVQDYLLSNSCMHEWIKNFLVDYPNPETFRRLLEVRAQFLDAAYQVLRLNYGSPEEYITDELGLTQNQIEALQKALLEHVD
jgi:protein-tyrosine phosphatase